VVSQRHPTHEPPWEEAQRRADPRRRTGPQDVGRVVEAELPSAAGYPIVRVASSLMATEDAQARGACIGKLQGGRCRLKLAERVRQGTDRIPRLLRRSPAPIEADLDRATRYQARNCGE